MARLNDDAQWIVLMGFIVSFSLFFLAIVLNQSTVVGQTTAEAVSEFPKEDIRGVREAIIQSALMDNGDGMGYNNQTMVQNDIKILSRSRQGSIVSFSNSPIGAFTQVDIHYNNGVTVYNESWKYP